jgi:23S rRNA (adenine-N6)-dimethyltransferase
MTRYSSRRKEYGQHFLHDRRLIRRLVEQAKIAPHDLVIEIGPGDGALTTELLRRARQVLAVELDVELVERLQARFPAEPGLILFAGDFLGFPLPCTPHKVFANLPYRHTAAIVGKLTSGTAPPDDMFLVMQLEAAQRFMGEPMGTLLAAQLAPWFEMRIVHSFRRTDFRPAPAVDSVMLRMLRRPDNLVPRDQRKQYLDLVSAVFSAWQPTVMEALRHLITVDTCRFIARNVTCDLAVRPSGMSQKAWVDLYVAFHGHAATEDWRRVAAAAERLQLQQATITRPSRTRARHGKSSQRR